MSIDSPFVGMMIHIDMSQHVEGLQGGIATENYVRDLCGWGNRPVISGDNRGDYWDMAIVTEITSTSVTIQSIPLKGYAIVNKTLPLYYVQHHWTEYRPVDCEGKPLEVDDSVVVSCNQGPMSRGTVTGFGGWEHKGCGALELQVLVRFHEVTYAFSKLNYKSTNPQQRFALK